MAYAPHVRFQMGGELDPEGTGAWNEVWQCTINGTGAGDPPEDAWLADRGPALVTWYANAANNMHPKSRLSWVKLNLIGPDGKYLHPTTPHTRSIGPQVGTGAAANPPPLFVGLCYSWTTANLRGPGHTGRIYLPNALNSTAPGTEVVSGTVQAGAVTSAKALLTLLNTAAAGWTFIPVVASKVNASNTTITGVRIGRVYDVQRRRKNKIAENYVSSTWP